MRQTSRVLAVLVLVGALAPSTQAVGKAVPRRQGCQKTFTTEMFERAARRVYATQRLPARGSYANLWRYARCQRPPSSESSARAFWQRLLRRWERLRHRTLVLAVRPNALALCIIWRESTSTPEHLNAQAINGQYEGIAQMSPTIWAEYGGTRYAATPLGATGEQQLAVLETALAAGGSGNWTPYDGC